MQIYSIISPNFPTPDKTVLTIDATQITQQIMSEVKNPPDMQSIFYQQYSATNTFADISAQPDFTDYAMFIRAYKKENYQVTNLGLGLNRLSNIFPMTLANRSYAMDYLFTYHDSSVLLALFVPFADTPPANWAIAVPGNGGVLETNGGTIITKATMGAVRQAVMPTIKLVQHARSNNIITLTATVYNADGTVATANKPELRFETTAGVILANRVVPDNGVATSWVDLANLPKGFALKVKVGFKYYPGVTEVALTA